MSDISSAALAAIPRKGKVFGVEVTYHPLTIGDLMDWDCWAQGQYRRGARFGMTDGTPEEQLRYRIEANDEAKLICFGNAHAERIEWSMTGCLYLCWLSLRHGNAKLTLEDTSKLFGWGSQSLDDQKLALVTAKREIHIATGLISEEVALGLVRPKKNETQTTPPAIETLSQTPPTGTSSTPTSGLSTSETRPG
jgi:hypothetical protein